MQTAIRRPPLSLGEYRSRVLAHYPAALRTALPSSTEQEAIPRNPKTAPICLDRATLHRFLTVPLVWLEDARLSDGVAAEQARDFIAGLAWALADERQVKYR